MVKEMMKSRFINWIGIILLLLLVLSTSYFYVTSLTRIRTIDSTLAMINNLLTENSFGLDLSSLIHNFFNLAMIQMAILFVMGLAFLLLLWFVFRLYLVQKTNALVDPLTGIYNRRAFMFGLKSESARARKFDHPLTLAILDVDHFKQYNDSFGHKSGDKALRKVAKIIEQTSGKKAIVGRIGGEEFGILFPEMNYSSASKICENIRQNIQKAKFDHEEKFSMKDVTISIGIAESNNTSGRRFDLFEEADKKLYLAKLAGRNRVK
jgi:diguanylate cyclase (GGDEF)-like protein